MGDDELTSCSAFLFVLFFLRRAETRRWTECLTTIEQRKIAYVQRQRARRRLLIDDDRHRTTFNAFAKCDAAATGEPSVRKALQHRSDHTTSPSSLHRSGAILAGVP